MEAVELVSRSSLFALVQYSAVPILAIFLTWATGFERFTVGQGFPTPWKNVIVCPGVGMEFPSSTRMLSICYVIGFNWIAFAIDALFYTTAGYTLFLGYAQYQRWKTSGLPPRQL